MRVFKTPDGSLTCESCCVPGLSAFFSSRVSLKSGDKIYVPLFGIYQVAPAGVKCNSCSRVSS